MISTPTYQQIHQLPKLEMHIHLEGTISPELVKHMAEQQNVSLPRPLDDLYDLNDLATFLATLDWVCSLISTTNDVIKIAENFSDYCQQQNIHYCELIINPTHWRNIHFSELLPALPNAFDSVYQNHGIDIRLLPSILRQQSSQEAEQFVQWMGECRQSDITNRIIGLSIDGNELAAGRTGERFAKAYSMAREFGFGLTAHAGESSGPSGVVDALDLLQVDRIDHGVRAADDPSLVTRLVDEQVTLNVCLSSNCCILYSSIEQHPFKQLLNSGVKMTLNTDDPVVLNTTLCDELVWVADQMALTLPDIVSFQRQAILSAFCDDATKKKLMENLNKVSDQLLMTH